MSSDKILLEIDHNSTYVKGRMDGEVYKKFKKALGYQPENSFWMIKNNAARAKPHEKWKEDWDGWISAVCWNKKYCHCHIKKKGLHFHSGLIGKAVEFFKENNIPFRRIDIRNKVNKTNIYSMSEDFEERDYQQEVIQKVVGGKEKVGIDRGIIKCATGGGKCISKDSLCLTEDGMYEIGEIEVGMDEGGYKEKQINVYTPLNSNNRDLSSHVYRDGIKDSIKLTTSYGYSITGTPNHKVIVMGGRGDFEWKRLDEITDRDIIVLSKNQNMFGDNDKWTIEEAYLLGLLYGDGNLSRKNGMEITTADNHIEDYVFSYAHENGMQSSVYVHNKYRQSLFDREGDAYLSDTKTIPLSIRTSTKSVIAAFIRGVYETYGCVEVYSNKMSITLVLSNEKLIDQIHYILLNMGIVSSKRRKKTTHRDCFILTIYRDFIKKFIDTIGWGAGGYTRDRSYKYYNDFINRKNNSNKDLIYNQSKNIRDIRSIVRDILGRKKYRDVVEEESNTKINVLRLWSDKSHRRNPSRSSLLSFIKWAEYKFSIVGIGSENERYDELTNLISKLIDISDDKYYYDSVKRVERCQSDNYDFVVPDTHSFVSNGIINHNTGIAAGIIAGIGVLPTVFYVPSIDLLKQTHDELVRFVRKNGKSIDVGMVGGGRKDIQDITVMTIQTAVRALGGVWIKFDEEDTTKDDTDIDDVKDDIRNLIRSSRLMICDEVQHWAAETCQIISDASVLCQYRYGFSVFPDSVVELRGGCFGNGVSCSIEEAWNIIFQSKKYYYHEGYGYETVEVEGIESRGWSGSNFIWKPAKRFIRHINNKKAFSIRFAGSQKIKMTEDHSIFKLDGNSVVKCMPSEISLQDILLMDDGKQWCDNSIHQKTILEILSKDPKKIRVALDLTDVDCELINMPKWKYSQLTSRGEMAREYGGSLYLEEYLEYKHVLPYPKWIYTEGANGVGVNPTLTITDISYICGFYVGYGWINGNRLNFAVGEGLLDSFINRLKIDKISINPKVRKMEGKSYEVRCACLPLARFVNYHFKNKKCCDKFIPESILFAGKNTRLSFLQGLIDSDDSCKKTREDIDRDRSPISFTTTSKDLMFGICSLLRSLNVSYTISERTARLGGVIKGGQICGKRVSYQILWSGNALKDKNNGKYGNVKRTEINCIEKKVLAIDEITYGGYVYDLEMEGHPSFVANGVLVHNSATPWRDKGDDILIDGCFGKCIADISASFLIKKGYLVKPTIHFSKVSNMRGLGRSSYPNVYRQAIVENELRNNMIVTMAIRFRDEGRKVLILVKQIAHGKILEKLIPDSIFLHGSTGKKKRQKHLDLMREAAPRVTIASVIFDEGIDCRPLDTLILAGGGKSPTRALQRIGRILRPYDHKRNAIAVDFLDNCKYMQSHSKRREAIYKTEKEFNIIGE